MRTPTTRPSLSWMPAAILGTGLLVGCSDGPDSFTPMVGPSTGRTPVALVITGCPVAASACRIAVGDQPGLVASLLFSDGAMEKVAGVWTSDAPDVVEVDHEGRARGVTPGSTVVRVEAAGRRGALSFNVDRPRLGRWVGEYVVRGCESSGSGSYLTCADHRIGARVRLYIDLRGYLGAVSGWIGFVDYDLSLEADASSRVDDAGNLLVTASGFDGWSGSTYAFDPLSARIRGSVLEGTLTMRVAAEGAVIVVSADLDDMVRQE